MTEFKPVHAKSVLRREDHAEPRTTVQLDKLSRATILAWPRTPRHPLS